MLPPQIQAITSKRQGGDDLCMTDAAFLAVGAAERAASHIWVSSSIALQLLQTKKLTESNSSFSKMDTWCCYYHFLVYQTQCHFVGRHWVW